MHQLGDQWIEIIDGQEHMVKAVKGDECRGCRECREECRECRF